MSAQVQCHTLGHEVFDVEVPQALQVIARVGTDMPHTGLRSAVQRIVKAIEPILWLDDNRTRDLSIRAQHVKLHGLIGKRLTVTVAQQAVEDHCFTRTIEIARAKHKELLAVAGATGNIELRQIQRRKLEVKQRGLTVFARQNQRGFFLRFKLRMTVSVALRLSESLAFVVQQRDGHAGLRRTVFQTLSENIQAVMVTVSGQTNIA